MTEIIQSKNTEEEIKEIKSILKSDKLVVGTDRSLKEFKAGNLKKVFLASNSDGNLVEEFGHYTEVSGTEVVMLGIPNDELGVVCQKPFSISVLGVMND